MSTEAQDNESGDVSSVLEPAETLQQLALSAPTFFPNDDPDEFRSVYTEWRSRLIHAAGGCNCLRT